MQDGHWATDYPSEVVDALLPRRAGFYSSQLVHWLDEVATLNSDAAEPRRGRKLECVLNAWRLKS